MSPSVNVYLDKLYDSLHTLPEEVRLDAVREIKSHILHGIQDGQAERTILARLGNPRKLARAYRNEYFMKKKPRSFKEILTMTGFYCTAGLLSIAVVPILSVIAYGFGFCAILIVLAGIIRTFGVTWIDMSIGPNYSVPILWSIPFAIVVGGIIGAIAYFSWKSLKKYLSLLSERYRNMLETTVR